MFSALAWLPALWRVLTNPIVLPIVVGLALFGYGYVKGYSKRGRAADKQVERVVHQFKDKLRRAEDDARQEIDAAREAADNVVPATTDAELVRLCERDRHCRSRGQNGS